MPDWWVIEARGRLKRRSIDIKVLAGALKKSGQSISEMMVLRALHRNVKKRVASIETLEAVSDALGIPRPIVVAHSLAEALEIQSAVAFSAADATRLQIESEIARSEPLPYSGESDFDGDDGRNKRTTEAVVGGGARIARGRSPAVRGTPRSR